MNNPWQHTTVLLNEAVDALLAGPRTVPGGAPPDQAPHQAPPEHGQAGHASNRARVFVDATFGRGGHARLLLTRLDADDRLVAFDKDPDAVAAATRIQDPRFSIRHQGFRQLGELPAGSVTGLLLDLGVSSPQIDNPARGFSFRSNGPLDMRMDSSRGQSVADWLATADQEQIAEVIRDYGEDRFAAHIAKAIVARRQERGPLASTGELAQLVAGAVRTREPGQDPATRTFQAFRIFINAEL